MSGIEQQKNINFGAKITGKIAAGIFFTGNDDVQTLPGGNAWVRIGAGVVGHPLFILMPVQPVSAPSSAGINDYFELQNPAGPTEIQALWYRYGKRAVHYCEYSLTIIGDVGAPVDIGTRISSINPDTLVVTQYPHSVRSVTAPPQTRVVQTHTFPIVAPTSDAFYIEVTSLSGQTIASTIEEAFLSLGE